MTKSAYQHEYYTSFHGYPIELLRRPDTNWWQARAHGGPLNNLSAFNTSPAAARNNLQRSLENCVRYGTEGSPGRTARMRRPRRKGRK